MTVTDDLRGGVVVCGIVACRLTGGAEEFLLPALRRLEYRGYDSAGIAVTGPGQGGPHTVRAVGRLDALLGRLSARPLPTGLGIGVGHTRWCRRRTRIRIGIARARSRWCTADPPGHVDRAAQSEHARHTGT